MQMNPLLPHPKFKPIPEDFENLVNTFLISSGSFPRKRWIAVFIYYHSSIGYYSREFDGSSWILDLECPILKDKG